MSFYPFELIFIGGVGDNGSFIGYSEISNFNPANEIFSQKDKFTTFRKCYFWGVMSKIEFEQNWRYGYILYYGFGSKQSIDNFP